MCETNCTTESHRIGSNFASRVHDAGNELQKGLYMPSAKPSLVVMLMLLLPQISSSALMGQTSAARYETVATTSSSIDASSSSSSFDQPKSEQPEKEDARRTNLGPSGSYQGAAPSHELAPFRSWKIAFIANTLGAGFDVSTSLARHFDLRGGANFLSLSPAFDVDGLHYSSSVHLRSGRFGVDWFPRHRNFHITPSIMYFNNNLTALTHVPAGARFDLDDNSFVSDTTDPVHGDAGLVYPHHVAPMISVGFNNILPGHHRHISVPLEFGVAYTGAPSIHASLVGTACQTDGCFKFEENEEAQQSLKNEVKDINDTLSSIPVYPVLSIGFAYRF
jgi:hypothetical protein